MSNPHNINSLHDTPLVPVTGLDFDDEVLQSALPVLVDVTAAWCPPCRAAEPVIESLARQRFGQLKVVRLDGEDAPDLVARLQVRGFPTFLLYVAGREVRRQAGFAGAQALHRFIDAT